jgi:predicted transposase YdaD
VRRDRRARRGDRDHDNRGEAMRKPFDATTRNLYTMDPAEWSAFLGWPVADPGRLRQVDSDLSTITAEVDRVIRLEDPIPWLWNIEFQTGRDLDLPFRLHFYSTLLHHHHKLPVRTTLVLLRPAADGPDLTGYLEQRHPDGEIYDWFRYDVVRVWQQPVEKILAAGLTVLPLAPIAQVERDKVRDVMTAMSDRFERETTLNQAETLWYATGFLMGLRYSPDEIRSFSRGGPQMLFGIRGLEESSVYQEALRKGEASGSLKEARTILLRHGTKKLGPPDEKIAARISALADVARLQDLIDRVLDVASWDELLGSPNP